MRMMRSQVNDKKRITCVYLAPFFQMSYCIYCNTIMLIDYIFFSIFKILLDVYIDLSGAFRTEIRFSPLFFSGWDGDMATILLLVYLLPPSGKKGTVKISIREAVDRVVKFHKVSEPSLPTHVLANCYNINSNRLVLHDTHDILQSQKSQFLLNQKFYTMVLPWITILLLNAVPVFAA